MTHECTLPRSSGLITGVRPSDGPHRWNAHCPCTGVCPAVSVCSDISSNALQPALCIESQSAMQSRGSTYGYCWIDKAEHSKCTSVQHEYAWPIPLVRVVQCSGRLGVADAGIVVGIAVGANVGSSVVGLNVIGTSVDGVPVVGAELGACDGTCIGAALGIPDSACVGKLVGTVELTDGATIAGAKLGVGVVRPCMAPGGMGGPTLCCGPAAAPVCACTAPSCVVPRLMPPPLGCHGVLGCAATPCVAPVPAPAAPPPPPAPAAPPPPPASAAPPPAPPCVVTWPMPPPLCC
jgi:hypothetical protein